MKDFDNSPTAQLHPSPPGVYAAMFRALANPARLAVFEVIRTAPSECCPDREGSICACDIAKRLGLSASMVSHHLRELRLANLIRTDKRGQWVHCSVNPEALRALGRFAGETAPERAPAEDTADAVRHPR